MATYYHPRIGRGNGFILVRTPKHPLCAEWIQRHGAQRDIEQPTQFLLFNPSEESLKEESLIMSYAAHSGMQTDTLYQKDASQLATLGYSPAAIASIAYDPIPMQEKSCKECGTTEMMYQTQDLCSTCLDAQG
jgi:hypothetical protein